MNEFRTLSREKWVNIKVGVPLPYGLDQRPANTLSRSQLHKDDIFKWDIALIVLNEDSVYYGGYFKARMTFPKNYPYAPPGMLHVCYHSDTPSPMPRLTDTLFHSHIPVTRS